METKTITKTYEIVASIDAVFEALTNANLIEKWSGSPAIMELSEGGKFSLWDGSIHGINKYLSIDKIIQDWKEEKWNDFSTVTFKLTAQNDLTILSLLHEKIPSSSAKSIDNGWDDYYLGPLKELLES